MLSNLGRPFVRLLLDGYANSYTSLRADTHASPRLARGTGRRRSKTFWQEGNATGSLDLLY